MNAVPPAPSAVARHPCYSEYAHSRYGRIHVPVAPRCNIQCNYCVRRFDCANENRPGVTTRVVTPEQALETVRRAVHRDPRMAVVGVAGPGDALANDATFETLDLVGKAFPELARCVSTNGLLLLDRLDDVLAVGVTALTVTVNAVTPQVGRQIYARARYRGRTYLAEQAFEVLARQQLEGLRQAARLGVEVKVNSVLIPGVNDDHMPLLARTVRALGARVLNIIPMIPMGAFAQLRPPSDAEVASVRAACGHDITQFANCQRCRADAIGVPGELCAAGADPAWSSPVGSSPVGSSPVGSSQGGRP